MNKQLNPYYKKTYRDIISGADIKKIIQVKKKINHTKLITIKSKKLIRS
ncbi:hypothetical protein HYD46_02035 [Mycoplasmopsis bovis]|nr:hypothetical protein [Mycoplasmopsis bovis]QQH78218.1 hypothetical protein HYD46_02035 [Mycoplasmopsis bovis]